MKINTCYLKSFMKINTCPRGKITRLLKSKVYTDTLSLPLNTQKSYPSRLVGSNYRLGGGGAHINFGGGGAHINFFFIFFLFFIFFFFFWGGGAYLCNLLGGGGHGPPCPPPPIPTALPSHAFSDDRKNLFA